MAESRQTLSRTESLSVTWAQGPAACARGPRSDITLKNVHEESYVRLGSQGRKLEKTGVPKRTAAPVSGQRQLQKDAITGRGTSIEAERKRAYILLLLLLQVQNISA